MTRSTRLLLLSAILLTMSCQSVHVGTPSNPGNPNPNPNPGNTISAASCSLTDVQSAMARAHDGDTVTIPAGTCTWTSTLRVPSLIYIVGSDRSAGISEIGSAGGGQTVLIDNVDKSNCNDQPLIDFENEAEGQGGFGLGDVTIQGMAADSGQCSEEIKAATYSHAFRFHDLTFTMMQTTGISLNGDEWGVIDHSTFNGSNKRGILIQHEAWGQIGSSGDNSWAQPDTMGTEKAVYAENNMFNITNASGVGSVACQGGGRCVARYNILPYLGTHGTDSSQRLRSIRHLEVYENTFNDNGSPVGEASQLRGGTELFFNNTISPTAGVGSYPAILVPQEYRETDQWTPWGSVARGYKGGCDGTGPFDNNANGGAAFGSGTHNGSSGGSNVLTDTTKNWTTNQWVGYSLVNHSTGPWGASIKSNTATTITTYPASTGVNHTWNAGDGYAIYQVYPCLDQPGRGAGTYISGGAETSPPSPSVWPSQAADPIYAWNNTEIGSGLVPAISASYTHVQANRDYYDWTSSFDGTSGVGQGLLSVRPSTCTPHVAYWATDTNTLYQCASTNSWIQYYSPYTYPHPLTVSP